MNRLMQRPITIAFALLVVLCLPSRFVENVRGCTVQQVEPLWTLVSAGFGVNRRLLIQGQDRLRLERLEQENALLLRQLDFVKNWLISEERVDRDIEQFNELSKADLFHESRKFSMLHRIESEKQSLQSRVIFREPATWSQMLWIDVGEEDNENLSTEVVQKNSPILVGNSLFGIVERVERKKSLVRLITDPTINVAVRVVRGGAHERMIASHIDQLISLIRHEKRHELKVKELEIFKEQLDLMQADELLAKGILHGSSFPLGRSYTQKLSGEGFNYDYDDSKGNRRDLRTGVDYGAKHPELVTLIQEGDLLETSGLDAMFPEGIYVGCVEKVLPLQEGAVSYAIRARSVIPSLDAIKYVQVLPPARG